MEAKNIQEQISGQLAGKLNLKIDEAIIEGLRLKGFEFDNRLELEDFIKTRCRAEDYPHLKERIYFVDNKPFLKWYYKFEISPVISQDNNYSISAEAGVFGFIS